MSFVEAQAFTSSWEGGYVDNPADPGGATKYGVSLRFLQALGHDVDHDGDVDAADVRALSPAEAAAIFKTEFWDALDLTAMPELTATAVYDSAVNVGRSQAVKFLQEACNFYPGSCLTVDGGLGPKTLSRVFLIAGHGAAVDLALALRVLKARRGFYVSLAQKKPSLSVFLKGWINRVAALEKYLSAGVTA